MKKPRKAGISAKDAAFEQTPDMLALDHTLRGLLKVPKKELDARLAAEKAATNRQKEQ